MQSPSQQAFEFEKYLIAKPKKKDVPARAWKLYQEALDQLEPVSIAKHPKRGFAVIGSFGQGPMIIWSEENQVKDNFNTIISLVIEFGWNVAIPEVKPEDELPGMIIGNSEYIESILKYLPSDFSKKLRMFKKST